MKTNTSSFRAAVLLAALIPVCAADRTPAPEKQSPLDRYIEESRRGSAGTHSNSPGSLWAPTSRLTDLGSDLRAGQVNDLVTILVLERASAVAQGTTKTQRQSAVNASVGAIGGVTKA